MAYAKIARSSIGSSAPVVRLASAGLLTLASFIGCAKKEDQASKETIARAKEAYLECMTEHGINIGSVTFSSDGLVDIFIMMGDYTGEEANEASTICEERVQPILLAPAGKEGENSCSHELSEESEVAGKLGIAFDQYNPEGCEPDAVAWEATVSPVLEEHCGTCHGSEPAFGAPLSLTDYGELVSGPPGRRVVDRIALRVASHTMPPPSSPQLEHQDLDLLVEWATCGEVHPDPSVGLAADKPRYAIDVPENVELPNFELLADNFALAADALDRYQCFGFDLPIDEARLLRRIQVSLDESRVLHHMLVIHDPSRISEGDNTFRCEDWPRDNTPILWAWAPGGGAFDFEEGGLRLEPTDRIVVQIHYNNGAGLEGVGDNTGVRLFHGPTGRREWSLLTTGPDSFLVPEGTSVACGDTGPISSPMRVLAAFPHMHRLGAELHTQIERADGSTEDLINLTGWNFEAQQFYSIDAVLEVGDNVDTWCAFRNNSGVATSSGSRTDQEMCYNFLYVSPD